MVKIALIELPVQFIRNLPRIKIQFDVAEDTSQHHGKLVNIVLRNRRMIVGLILTYYKILILYILVVSPTVIIFSKLNL